MFHLHRFQDDEQIVHRNRVSIAHRDFYDLSRHRRSDASVCAAVRMVCGRVRGGRLSEVQLPRASIRINRDARSRDIGFSDAVLRAHFAREVAGDLPRVRIAGRVRFQRDRLSCVFKAKRHADAADSPRRLPSAKKSRGSFHDRLSRNRAFCSENRLVETFGEKIRRRLTSAEGLIARDPQQQRNVCANSANRKILQCARHALDHDRATFSPDDQLRQHRIVINGNFAGAFDAFVHANAGTLGRIPTQNRTGGRKHMIGRVLGIHAAFDRPSARRDIILR